jgi:hypothetical protein
MVRRSKRQWSAFILWPVPMSKAAEEYRTEAQRLRERAQSIEDDDDRRRELVRIAEIYENWARESEEHRRHW